MVWHQAKSLIQVLASGREILAQQIEQTQPVKRREIIRVLIQRLLEEGFSGSQLRQAAAIIPPTGWESRQLHSRHAQRAQVFWPGAAACPDHHERQVNQR